ncbi:MAG: PIN domain-containing protein [Actinobacteria bacterium]|nr:MAG: PIN domain-containing protein [Actinomycetota bacterium]
MKVLFDTNVVLDHLLGREPYADTAEQLLNLVDTRRIDGVICSTTATTIHYLASKSVGASAAIDYLRKLLAIFDVACVDREVLQGALDLGFTDFEDAVLHEAACRVGATAIVTRNGKDFARSSLPVFDPAELLAAVCAQPK